MGSSCLRSSSRCVNSRIGNLLPVVCSLPPVDDDEDEVQSVASDFPMADVTSTSVNKGKRKARPGEE